MSKIYYKGTNKDMTCRGFKYEPGEEYAHDSDVELCRSGFHACEFPLDVLFYYGVGSSRFFEVELQGVSASQEQNSKVVGNKLKFIKELSVSDLIKASMELKQTEHVPDAAHSITDEDYTCSVTTEDHSHAATLGYHACSVTTGKYTHSVSTGDRAHAVTTGKLSHSSTTGESSHSVSTGDYTHSVTIGDYAHAVTSGVLGRAHVGGKRSCAVSLGYQGEVRGDQVGDVLVCAWYDRDYTLVGVKTETISESSFCRPGRWYRVNVEGEWVEVEKGGRR